MEFLTSSDERDQSNTEKDPSCLECLGCIGERLVLQPTSLDSEIHARMSLKISEKFKKESK